MAVGITDDFTLTFKIPLKHEDAEFGTRTLTIPAPKTTLTESQLETALTQFRTRLAAINNYEWLFQPTAWRDYDSAESAWTLNGGVEAITMEFVQKRTSVFGKY